MTVDLATPARAVALELIARRWHYDRVIARVLGAKASVWIATANTKELMVDDGRARGRLLRNEGSFTSLTEEARPPATGAGAEWD